MSVLLDGAMHTNLVHVSRAHFSRTEMLHSVPSNLESGLIPSTVFAI